MPSNVFASSSSTNNMRWIGCFCWIYLCTYYIHVCDACFCNGESTHTRRRWEPPNKHTNTGTKFYERNDWLAQLSLSLSLYLLSVAILYSIPMHQVQKPTWMIECTYIEGSEFFSSQPFKVTSQGHISCLCGPSCHRKKWRWAKQVQVKGHCGVEEKKEGAQQDGNNIVRTT